MSKFGLASYRENNQLLPALMVDDKLYDLRQATDAGVQGCAEGWRGHNGVQAMLNEWEHARTWVESAEEASRAVLARQGVTPLPQSVRLAPPYVPSRIFCVASNFAKHADEMGTKLAAKANSKPYMFLKLSNTVIGDSDVIQRPPETQQLDWEVELAAVVGRRARRVAVDDALNVIACYTVINDISARDINKRGDYPFKFDWFQGKCHDTFAPIGPWLVPASAIADPQSLRLRLDVNGESMQDDFTSNMIWSVAEQISYLSTIVTLEPGDMIATGTPTGVGASRGRSLSDGDVVTTQIDGIGKITNTVKDEVI